MFLLYEALQHSSALFAGLVLVVGLGCLWASMQESADTTRFSDLAAVPLSAIHSVLHRYRLQRAAEERRSRLKDRGI